MFQNSGFWRAILCFSIILSLQEYSFVISHSLPISEQITPSVNAPSSSSLSSLSSLSSSSSSLSSSSSSSSTIPKPEVNASNYNDEKQLENGIAPLSEIVISELEILELSGFHGQLANGHCCTGTKTPGRNPVCKAGNATCNTFWRICITDLWNDPSTGSLLLREVPDKKPGFTAMVSRFFESLYRSSESAQDKSDKGFSPYQMKELIDNPSNVRCRLGFYEKANTKPLKLPLKFSKTLTRRLLQNKNQLEVNEPIDLNVVLIVELRAKHYKNILKSALISRQVQYHTVHIPGVKGQTLLRESEFFLGGQEPLRPASWTSAPTLGPSGIDVDIRALFQNPGKSRSSRIPRAYRGASRYSGPVMLPWDNPFTRSLEQDLASMMFLGLRNAQRGWQRREVARRSEDRVEKSHSSGLWYKYRWRLKVYNKDVLMTLKNVTVDPHDQSLLTNLNDHGCNHGFSGNYCDVPICAEGCDAEHGYCEKPGECRCRLGWRGDNCSDCQPLPHCQRGTCQRPFECMCEKGFSGIFCSLAKCRDGCDSENGFCNEPGTCECKSGWRGTNCTECDTISGCLHGTCQQPLECNCKPGWTGPLCNTPICAADCVNGWCEAPDECRCNVGFTGRKCDQCVPYPGCEHGRCAGNGTKPWTCECDSGFEGFTCDSKVGEVTFCELNKEEEESLVQTRTKYHNRCIHKGRCVPVWHQNPETDKDQATEFNREPDEYQCVCPPGYGGDHCERDNNLKQSN